MPGLPLSSEDTEGLVTHSITAKMETRLGYPQLFQVHFLGKLEVCVSPLQRSFKAREAPINRPSQGKI